MSSDSSKLKCSASELLAVYGLLRHCVATKVPRVPELQPHLASFDAACSVLDALLAAKRGELQCSEASALLAHRLGRHMQLRVAAYGAGGIRPKHH